MTEYSKRLRSRRLWLIRYSDQVDRVAATGFACTTGVVLASSTAIGRGPVTPLAATIAGIGYVAIGVALIAQPGERRLHRIALVLGAVFWGGRLAAFVAIVIVDGRPDLVGTVLERALIVASVCIYHSSGIVATPVAR